MTDAVSWAFCIIFIWGPLLGGLAKLYEKFRKEYR